MNVTERLKRIRRLVGEIVSELDAIAGGEDDEALETMPGGHGAMLDFGGVSDAVLAEFMRLETPVSIPTDLAGARVLFSELASEADVLGRRANFGHCWGVRVGSNGEFRIWTNREGSIERVTYVADTR